MIDSSFFRNIKKLQFKKNIIYFLRRYFITKSILIQIISHFELQIKMQQQASETLEAYPLGKRPCKIKRKTHPCKVSHINGHPNDILAIAKERTNHPHLQLETTLSADCEIQCFIRENIRFKRDIK